MARHRSAPTRTLLVIWFALLRFDLCLVSCEETELGNIFVPIKPDDVHWKKEIPFDPAWLEHVGGKASDDGKLPLSYLRPPDFIDVYDFALPLVSSESSTLSKACSETEEECDADAHPSMNSTATSPLVASSTSEMPTPFQIGQAARQTIDDSLAKTNTSGVLFRNMHRIKTAEDFAEFWRGCTSSSLKEGWKPAENKFALNSEPRDKVSGIDIVGLKQFPDTSKTVVIHNEYSNNPLPHAKIGFFCLQDASWGGESLLASNAAITESISKEIIDYVKEHGGIRMDRFYGDRDRKKTPKGTSWQERCGVETREEAMTCFKEEGFDEDNISFNRKGTARLINTLSGFRRDTQTDTDVWFNQLNIYKPGHSKFMLGDGNYLPMNMFQQLQFDMWKAVTVVKLYPGDFLILNNYAVMHGRLPYGNTEEITRALLSVYTK